MISINKQKGQGLLEAVLAVGVILTSVVLFISLSIAITDYGRRSESKTLATNLAREGIEAVRNKRDSNWLIGDPFYYGLTGSGVPPPQTFVINHDIDIISSSDEWKFVPNSDFGLADCYLDTTPICACYTATNSLCQLLINSEGFYNSSGSRTPYYRLVFIKPMTKNGIVTTPVNKLTTQMKVISQVYWIERGQAQTVTLETTLYDWQTNND
ncbi:MAG: hypothetical protein V1838_00450 [Patescibacteria group bacterium]